MKYFSIAASIIAGAATVHSAAVAQGGTLQPCTYTASTSTSCIPPDGIVRTITIFEVGQLPVVTSTQSFDCHGCADVSIFGTNCPSVTATTIIYEPTSVIPIPAGPTTSIAVCSPTPN